MKKPRVLLAIAIFILVVIGIVLVALAYWPRHSSISTDLNPPAIEQPGNQPTPPQGESATITNSSVGYTTPTPTVKGTASGISSVHVTYTAKQGGKVYDDGTFLVTNGSWFSMANQTLPLGDYTVTVSDLQNRPLVIGAFNTDSPLLRKLVAIPLQRHDSSYLIGAQMMNNVFPTPVCDPTTTSNCYSQSVQQYPIPTNYSYTVGPPPVKWADWRVLYPEREPVVGWFNNTQQTMDLEIQIAHNVGIDYFSIFWLPGVTGSDTRGTNKPGGAQTRNNAETLFLNSPYKNELRFGIVVDNAQDPIATVADWDTFCDQWVELLKQPQYVRLNGMPVIGFTAAGSLHHTFNGESFPGVPDTGAKGAVEELRMKAKNAGVPQILISSSITETNIDGHALAHYASDGFDFVTTSSNGIGSLGPTSVPQAKPYTSIVASALSYWESLASHLPSTAIQPVVVSNYQHLLNYGGAQYYTTDATPDKFGTFLQDAKSFVDAHQPGFSQKLIIIDGWDTVNQSSQMIPNITDQGAFAQEVTKVF